MDPTFLVFSLPEWKKLSAKDQQILAKAARDAGATVKAQAAKREADSLAQVKKLGMRVNELDLAPLQKAAATAQDELAREFDAQKLLERIRKAN
jgi:TRAP-type C4-dicarboxylate transport system substrate-binding protein